MIYIYSDGSYEKNTGMGCGVYIQDSPLNYSTIVYKPIDTQSSAPRAEMQAMFRALVVTSLIDDSCTIYCDNQYVTNTFNIFWDKWSITGFKKSGGGELSHMDLLQPMMEYYQANKYRISIIHIPREYNTIADGLSKDARLKLQFGEYREE